MPIVGDVMIISVCRERNWHTRLTRTRR